MLVPKTILTINFASSLGNGVFDPLTANSDSSDSYLENDIEAIPITTNSKIQKVPIKKEELFNKYQVKKVNIARNLIDYNKCVEINDRILCGYEKNKGLHELGQIIDLGNGCRIRGDRLECGYDSKNKLPKESQNLVMRQRPTRTPKSEISNKEHKINSDLMENILLKSALSKLLLKSEATENVAKPTVLIEPTKITNVTLNQIIYSTTEKVTFLTPKIAPKTEAVNQNTAAITQNNRTQSTESATESTESATESTESATESTELATDSTESATDSTESATQNTESAAQSTELLSESSKPILIKTIRKTSTTAQNTPAQVYDNLEVNDTPPESQIFKRAIPRTIITTETILILQNVATEPVPNLLTTVPSTTHKNSTESVNLQTPNSENATTACVENQERVVCYNFKT
ncbi:hypothetical protein HW555_000189 [Spodoptera exigua]|uniref:Uncharacterized protein n=1 Tax=Spodoptera exigua TaxID=7107 RepID=A0A835GWT4_SPOEX|nr:hypothetical protein HW555_000189 [Spodoptera exigua]